MNGPRSTTYIQEWIDDPRIEIQDYPRRRAKDYKSWNDFFARELAIEIALSAPLAVRSIRETLRGDLPERIREATDREKAEQERLQKTRDFEEGVRASAERRTPDFEGR